jgi:hypothetical protein
MDREVLGNAATAAAKGRVLRSAPAPRDVCVCGDAYFPGPKSAASTTCLTAEHQIRPPFLMIWGYGSRSATTPISDTAA